MANKLIFKDAEAARDAIMDSQKKEIAALYENWADEIGERAKYYSHKSTASAPVSERYYRELQKQLRATSQEISNEVYSKIKKNMYTVADAVVADNVKWLESFGFSKDGLNAAFSYVPDEIVRNLVTGQIYDSGWSLSARIWGDNEQTLKDIYQVMAKGLAENKPIYEIAKDLEKYVRPSAQLPWNLRAADGVKIYKKQVDYNAQRLARTLVQHGYQQSFVAATQKNPFITEYIWRSNGSRVCELCMARDGKHYKKDELELDHPNGMCTMEPVVVDDMVDKLADWFNSPDGTYPEIDEFAGNFGYNASKSNIKTAQDFVNKYGMSTKSPNAWFNSLTPVQKAEAKMLKEQSGLTWNEWYEQNVHSTGDATKDFVKKYGTSTKSPNAWYNSLTAAQKAEAKLLKEQSGLTWNDWYNKNVYAGAAPKTTTVKAFSSAQNKYLSPYGFSPDNMPTNFDDWSHKISHEQAGEILKSMGTSWSDPHPYQQLMKYYNANLTNANFVDQIVDVTTAAKKTTTTANAVKYSQDDIIKMLNSGSEKNYNTVSQLFAKHGFNIEDFFDENEILDTNTFMFKEAMAKVTGKPSTITNVASKVDDAFDAAKWADSVRKNNLGEMDRWTNDWLKTITSTEKSGVRTYTGSAYTDMNEYLRGQRKTTRYADEIKACQSALSKASLPRETVVRRGSGYNMLNELGIGSVTPQNKDKFIGAIVTDKGFVSTSPSPHGGFSGSIEYVIRLPQGSQAMYVDSISRFQGEEELLINCGGKYQVEDVEFNSYGDVKKIYMTLKNLKNN